MPIIQVNMLEGRTDDQKEKLVAELTQAVVVALEAPQESVRVMINEFPNTHFGVGGKTAKQLGR